MRSPKVFSILIIRWVSIKKASQALGMIAAIKADKMLKNFIHLFHYHVPHPQWQKKPIPI
ncbi:hypothetical protein BJP44_08875 [Candidatus Williamhamiltonella defendens]|nr:hypothetical protein BJP44_08875 [Candidatus Hamiltonella defensa]